MPWALSRLWIGTFLLIYPEFASCFNRFPEHRNPMYGCADEFREDYDDGCFARPCWPCRRWRPRPLAPALDASAQTYPNQRRSHRRSVLRRQHHRRHGSHPRRRSSASCGSSRSSSKTGRVSPGTTAVAKSAPDGYTLMLTSNGHTVAGADQQESPVRSGQGFRRRHRASRRCRWSRSSRPTFRARPEGFHRAAQRRSRASSISPRPGLPARRISSARYSKAGCQDQHRSTCPIKGAPEATTAVIRGDVQMYIAPIPATQELSATGKVKAIAINSRQARSANAGRADRRGNVAGLRIRLLVRRAGARRHAAGDPRPRSARTSRKFSRCPTSGRSCWRKARFPRRPRRPSSTPSTRPTPSVTARSSRTPALRRSNAGSRLASRRCARRSRATTAPYRAAQTHVTRRARALRSSDIAALAVADRIGAAVLPTLVRSASHGGQRPTPSCAAIAISLEASTQRG